MASKRGQHPHHNQPPNCLCPPRHFHRIFINIYSLWCFSLEIVEYLLFSGKKCLDFQENNKINRELGTPVEIPNLSLPLAADAPQI